MRNRAIITMIMILALFIVPVSAVEVVDKIIVIQAPEPAESWNLEPTPVPESATEPIVFTSEPEPVPALINAEPEIIISGNKVIPRYVCACGLTVEKFKIVNDKEESSSYNIELEGTAAVYATAYPQAFTLPPGGQVDVTIKMRFPCSLNQAYILSTKITELGGQSKRLSQAYVTKKCPNIQIYSSEPGQVSKICKSTTFRFDVTNAGQDVDTFHFSVKEEELAEYIKLSADSVTLTGGQTQTVFVTVDLPCNMTGRHDFTLITETKGSKLKAQTPFALLVDNNYEFNLLRPTKLSLCENVPYEFRTIVENLESFKNDYYMNFSGLEWVPDAKTVTVEGDSALDVNFTITAPTGSAGTHTLGISASGLYGSDSSDKFIELEVKQCYDYSMTVELPKGKVCCDIGTIPVTLTNNGSDNLSLSLDLIAPDYITIEAGWVQLAPGASEEIPIRVEPSTCNTGDVDLKVTSNIDGVQGLEISKSASFEFVNISECSTLEHEYDYYKVKTLQDSFGVLLKNTGIKTTNYSLELYADDWLNLQNGYLVIDPEGYATVSIGLDAHNITPGKYYFWLKATDENGDYFEFPLELNLKKECSVLRAEAYAFVKDNTCSFVYRLLLTLFVISLLLIFILAIFRRSSKKIRKRSKLKSLIVGLLYLLGVFLIAGGITHLVCNYGLTPITGVIDSPINETNMTSDNLTTTNITNATEPVVPIEPVEPEAPEPEFVILIPENGSLNLNLSTIFSDPDADILFYSIVGPSALDVEVDNAAGMAVLTPTEDFEEGSTIVVTVSDGEYTLTSPEIALFYKSDEMDEGSDNSNSSEAIEFPNKYIYLILIILILIILVKLLFDNHQEKKEEEKRKAAKKKAEKKPRKSNKKKPKKKK